MSQSEHSDAAEMSNWTKAYMLLVAIRSQVTFSRAISVHMEVELLEVELMCVSNHAEVKGKRAGQELDLEAKKPKYLWL